MPRGPLSVTSIDPAPERGPAPDIGLAAVPAPRNGGLSANRTECVLYDIFFLPGRQITHLQAMKPFGTTKSHE